MTLLSQEQHTTKWLRQRAIGQVNLHRKPNSHESVKRLKLESVLIGHQGCVNCIQWNERGNLLASGSDDHNVILWRPFEGDAHQRSAIISTGHEGTIFSVKFMPQSNDDLIATCASDHGVRVINSVTGNSILKCQSCHTNRVKRLEVHPNEPNLIWSAAEDGLIMQYDLREEHSCKGDTNRKPKNLLIDLKSCSDYSVGSAKCLAMNPVRDEMLAIGSDDVYVRLFDRRLLRQTSHWTSSSPNFCCTAYFSPGHMLKKPSYQKSSSQVAHQSSSVGITYLAFNQDGHELLANYHAEQVYLFNIFEPTERYKSFQTTAQPLILDQPIPIVPNRILKNRKTYSKWRDLKALPTSKEISALPQKHRDFYDRMNKKLRLKEPLLLVDHDILNKLLTETIDCPELYHLRASALIQRGWRGDYYQAICDCCCALALKPLDYQSIENLAFASYFMNDKEAVHGLLELMKVIKTEFGALHEAINALSTCMVRDSSSPDSSPTWLYGYPEQAAYDEFLTPPDNDDQMQAEDNESPSDASSNVTPRDTLISRMLGINSSNGYHKQVLEWPCTDRCSLDALDYSKRYCGHCNMNTDIKEANFFGNDGEFIVGGSDDGAFYIWEKETTNIVKAVHGDLQILNCLQAHPSIYMLATSGIEPTVKLWSPSGEKSYDVKSLDTRCAQNQIFINSDPLEAMMMMLYPTPADRDI